MNPYLERPENWGDFHERFIARLTDAIDPQLPEPYHTRIDENIYIHELSADERRLVGRPDIHVAAPKRLESATGTAVASSPASARVPLGIDILKLSFLEIRDARDEQVVTVIELLSPSNKDTGGDGEVYRNKVAKLLTSPVNFIELDLLRSGRRTPWDGLTPSDYSIVVSRYSDRPQVNHWPVGLRDRLPRIPVPLRGADADLVVDLQGVFDTVYDSARYHRYLYQKPPLPSLKAADAEWAAGLVANRLS